MRLSILQYGNPILRAKGKQIDRIDNRICERAESVSVRAQTLENKTIEIEATGLLARALQHEADHLNGILFIDRMSSAAKASLSSRLKRLQKETKRGIEHREVIAGRNAL